jgi:hypothetical protein
MGINQTFHDRRDASAVLARFYTEIFEFKEDDNVLGSNWLVR